ncbi:hypothetical protein A2U01_0094021, partial [Trifolium medium]|nr:hypothetical protein [Trifolium medium]
ICRSQGVRFASTFGTRELLVRGSGFRGGDRSIRQFES